MEGEFRRGGLVGPIILIGLGVVFLLNNLGVLAWNVWDVVLQTWPLLLIAWGIDLLIVRRTTEATLLTLILLIVVLAGGVWLVSLGGDGSAAPRVESVQIPLPSAEMADIRINPGVGILQLRALESEDDLVAGKLGLGRGQKVETELQTDEGVPIYSLGSKSGWFWPAFRTGHDAEDVGENEWRLGLNTGVPIRLRTDLGAGVMDLDLSEVTLEDLQVDLGVGKISVVLPATGEFDAKISAAIGLMEIWIPRDLAVRITLNTGLSVREMEGFRQEGDVYYSPAAGAGGEIVDLDLNLPIGRLVVRLR